MALLWVLRDPRITTALIGARNVEQLDDSLDALAGPPLSAEELKEIDRHAINGGIDLWHASASRQ
jgi:L-glyceraldehyde 3-phosphate reductase